jgi:predicted GNAT family N-acyltransferase
MYLKNELIGCGRVFEIEDSVYRLGRIAVLKEYRNNGYGAALLKELERRAASHGAKYVTILGILSASDFYRKAGYKQIGGVVFDENVPSVYMRKKIL